MERPATAYNDTRVLLGCQSVSIGLPCGIRISKNAALGEKNKDSEGCSYEEEALTHECHNWVYHFCNLHGAVYLLHHENKMERHR